MGWQTGEQGRGAWARSVLGLPSAIGSPAETRPGAAGSRHDGHEDYLKALQVQLGRDVSPRPAPPDSIHGDDAPGMGRGIGDWLLRKIEIVAAISIGIAIGVQVMRGAQAMVKGEMGFGGLIFLFAAFLFGVIGGSVFLVLARSQRDRPLRRIGVLAAGYVGFVLFFVAPLQRAAEENRAQTAERARQAQEAQAALEAGRAAWLEGMKADGRHGPPGQVPPQISVQDDGTKVVVANTTRSGFMVALARVQEDAAAPGGYQACSLVTEGQHSRYHRFWLAAGATASFVPLTPQCGERLQGAPLEYRVGEHPDATAFWSDSAFAAPKGREGQGYESARP
jgi:hypothetical protein